MVFEELDHYHFIPETVGRITWAKPVLDEEDHMYCQVSGYDAGMIYKCKFEEIKEELNPSEPVDAFALDDETEISSWLEKDNSQGLY